MEYFNVKVISHHTLINKTRDYLCRRKTPLDSHCNVCYTMLSLKNLQVSPYAYAVKSSYRTICQGAKLCSTG
jgi:hypothetical protein